MLRNLLWNIARWMDGPLSGHADRSPMPPEEYDEMVREYNEEKLRLDAQLYWATVWDEEDRHREHD